MNSQIGSHLRSDWHRREFLTAVSLGGLLATLDGGATTAAAAEVDWLREIQTPPARLPPTAPLLSDLLVDTAGNRIQTRADWERRRGELRQAWLDFLGPLSTQSRPATKFEVLERESLDGIRRWRVRYDAEPGLPTEAYLLMPEKIDRPCPGVAVFHSTVNNSIRQPAGVEGQPEKAFGWQLARRGCVAFCPRNFLWPTNDMIAATAETERFQQRHPQSKGMAKMLYDAHLAIDLLAAMPEVDAHRLGAIGHSLGAKEVLYLAAFDERVKVTISSEGGIGTRFSNWDAGWYLGPTIKQPEFRREHHELLAMAAPRSFLLLGGDSADGDQSWPFITAALPVYRLYEGSPRVGLFNHRQGHSVPEAAEKRIAEWLDAYLLNA